MDSIVSHAFGWAVGAIGFAFLLLSLVAAYREVFPSEDHKQQMRGAGPEQYAALLAEVGKLKTWIALALVGSLLVFASGYAPAIGKMLGADSTSVSKPA